MKPVYYLYALVFLMSVVSFVSMGADKAKAKAKVRRIPEKTLFLLAICGGGIGGTLGMYLFRHKTKHWYFALFFPVLAAFWIAVCVYAALL